MPGRRPTFLITMQVELSPGPYVPLANEMTERIEQQRQLVAQLIRERLYEFNHGDITDAFNVNIVGIDVVRVR